MIVEYVPRFVLSLPGYNYPIGRSLTVHCDLKSNATLQYFNNSILQVNMVVASGYLDGTNKSQLCFKCTYDCGYCKRNFIDDYEKCMNPHSKYIAQCLFYEIN